MQRGDYTRTCSTRSRFAERVSRETAPAPFNVVTGLRELKPTGPTTRVQPKVPNRDVLDRAVQLPISSNRIMQRPVRVACLSGLAVLLAALVVGARARDRSLGHETRDSAPIPAPAEDPQASFKTQVRSLLKQQNFVRLDEMADELNRTKARFPGGDWESYRFIETLADPVEGEKAPDDILEDHLAVLRRWRA